MGVIYKLKKEIVDFIIDEKRLNPALGCRNLVNIIFQKFQLKVSKSSINAVIKEANLSSSVGRKSFLVKKNLKFKIPETRKEQLFTLDLEKIDPSVQPVSEIVSSGVVPNLGSPSTPLKSEKKPRIKKSNNAESSPVRKKETPSFSDVQKETALPPITPQSPIIVLQEQSFKETSLSSLQKDFRNDPSLGTGQSFRTSIGENILVDGAGAIFLKAAFLHLSLRKTFEDTLSKYFAPHLEHDVGLLSELLLLLPAFGIDRIEDLDAYRGDGLWEMADVREKVSSQKMVEFLNGVRDSRGFSLKIENEIPQIFSEAAFVKLRLEDSSEIIIDANYQIASNSFKDVGCSFNPISKAINDAIKKTVSNVQTVIIREISVNRDLNFLKKMIRAFDGEKGFGIIKVSIVDSREEILSEFTSIPVKTRNLIIGGQFEQINSWGILLSQEPSFIEMNSLIKDVRVFYYEEIVNLSGPDQGADQLLARILQIKVLEKNGREEKYFLISNYSDVEKKGEEILREYFDVWMDSRGLFISSRRDSKEPNMFNLGNKKGNLFILENTSASKKNQSFYRYLPEELGGFEELFNFLNIYCQKRIFPEGGDVQDFFEFFNQVYSLSGYIQKNESQWGVTLCPPEEYRYWEVLIFAIQRVNSFRLIDSLGRRVYVSYVRKR